MPRRRSAGVATGIQFTPSTVDGIRRAVHHTVALFRDRTQWTAMQRQGMKADVSWDRSAALYAGLFATLLPERGAAG